jgi:lipoprotein-anchoring transpeptidase ErfK/SrfK
LAELSAQFIQRELQTGLSLLRQAAMVRGFFRSSRETGVIRMRRRTFLALGLAVAGVASVKAARATGVVTEPLPVPQVSGEPFPISEEDYDKVKPQFRPQIIDYPTREPPGTIIIDTRRRYLFLVLGSGQAKRYGVGVGRRGFQWSGTATIGRKAKWPVWIPPAEMMERDREAAKWPDGMPGGPGNPLGARALYLGGTVYRIHGTNQPQTIGTAVSSGCFRLTNPDVTDLYERIPVGTKVVVRQRPEV